MINLQTLLNYTFLGFLVTAAFAPIVINMLYRFNLVIQHKLMGNGMNKEFMRIHGHKGGTPRSGGLMIALPVLLLVILVLPVGQLRTVFIVGWLLFLTYGVADDLIVSGRKVSEKLRVFQETFAWRIGKLLVLVLLSFLILWFATTTLGITEVTIIPNVLALPINLWSLVLLSFAAFAALFGIDLTDGADGLVTGQFMVLFAVFAVILVTSGNVQLLPYLGLITGASLVYLYFNIHPARVFMGGTGTLPIGFALLLFTLITDTLPIFFFLGLLFWIEVASSALQVIALKFFQRKLFKIAPIHHHFEAIGWPETKVVQRFWLATAVFALVGLWVYAMLYV